MTFIVHDNFSFVSSIFFVFIIIKVLFNDIVNSGEDNRLNFHIICLKNMNMIFKKHLNKIFNFQQVFAFTFLFNSIKHIYY